MQELVRFLTLYLAAEVEVGAALIVGFAAGEAMVRAVGGLLKDQSESVPKEEIRLRLGRGWRWQLNSSWPLTSSARWSRRPGMTIIVIRTALNFFLGRETEGADRRLETSPAVVTRRAR